MYPDINALFIVLLVVLNVFSTIYVCEKVKNFNKVAFFIVIITLIDVIFMWFWLENSLRAI